MKTEATKFYNVPVVADDACVFEVRAGIPAGLALDLATCQLDAAISTIQEAAGGLGKRPETGPLYTALYTLEQALALCYSINRSAMRSTDDQSEGEQGEALRLDLTDQELCRLRAVAEQDGADLPHTAARLLGAALRHHADVVAGGCAMSDQLPESFRWSYALSKMIPSAYEIGTNYGALPLDDELRAAVEKAVRPILERRLKRAERQESKR